MRAQADAVQTHPSHWYPKRTHSNLAEICEMQPHTHTMQGLYEFIDTNANANANADADTDANANANDTHNNFVKPTERWP